MTKKRLLFSLFLIVLATVACNALISPTEEPIVETFPPPDNGNIPRTEAEVPRVSLEEALTAYNAGAAIIVDVRSEEAYTVSHIPGARHILLGEFETNIENIDLPKDAWIITYCT